MDFVDRAGTDAILTALGEELSGDGELVSATPLPEALVTARDRVARNLALPVDWLNAGPASLLDFGFPAGFEERLVRRQYGSALDVSFAARLDQIHFKLYALVDEGPGKHEEDLRDLEPTSAELFAAARWARTHDPSDGFLEVLRSTLTHLGLEIDDESLDP